MKAVGQAQLQFQIESAALVRLAFLYLFPKSSLLVFFFALSKCHFPFLHVSQET